MSPVLLSMSDSEGFSDSDEESRCSSLGWDGRGLLSFVVAGTDSSGGEAMKGSTGRRPFRMEIRTCGRLNSPSKINDGR
jgi:hypothetical protein